MKNKIKVNENIECKLLMNKAGALWLRRRRRSLRRAGVVEQYIIKIIRKNKIYEIFDIIFIRFVNANVKSV